MRVRRIPTPDGRLALATEAARAVAWSVEVAAAISALHAQAALDLVELAEFQGEGYTHLLNRAPWRRIPTVIQLHGPIGMLARTLGWPEPGSDHERVGAHMEETCLRLADAIYSSSACTRDWCARLYGIDPALVPVLHSGIDTGLFQPREDRRSPRPTVVCTGRIAASKGADVLLAACLDLARELPGLRLRLIGRGEPAFVSALVGRARAAGAPDLLELPGFLEPEALAAELQAAHVFAAPSAYEGGPGFACLEAMAAGLPVVVGKGSGVEEVVREGVSGALVAPGDRAALASALRRLVGDGAERSRLGSQARAFAVAHADHASCVARIEAFYLEALARRADRDRPERAVEQVS